MSATEHAIGAPGGSEADDGASVGVGPEGGSKRHVKSALTAHAVLAPSSARRVTAAARAVSRGTHALPCAGVQPESHTMLTSASRSGAEGRWGTPTHRQGACRCPVT